MMSDRLVPFNNANEFWRASSSLNLHNVPDFCWLVRYFFMPTTLPVRSEEEIEAIAKELYRILGMEHKFVPQSK